MKATILTDVADSVLNECSSILGMEISVNKPEDAEIQIVFRNFVPTKNLKLVQTLSAGVDHFDFFKLPEGVTFCSNAGAYSDPVAEHAFALILSQEKDICGYLQDARDGIFKRHPVGTLSGATLGVLGYGGIGKSAARIAKGFKMKVIGYSRHPDRDTNIDEFAGTPEELFSKSDIVLISTPLSNETRGMVSKRLLSKFKGRSMVNVARADVVDEHDMLEFLHDHPDFHYLTDVWWNEPNVAFPIPTNAYLTPHVAGDIREAIDRSRFIYACMNVKKYLDGHPENVVNVSEYL